MLEGAATVTDDHVSTAAVGTLGWEVGVVDVVAVAVVVTAVAVDVVGTIVVVAAADFAVVTVAVAVVAVSKNAKLVVVEKITFCNFHIVGVG